MEDFQEYASQEGLYGEENMQVRRVCMEKRICKLRGLCETLTHLLLSPTSLHPSPFLPTPLFPFPPTSSPLNQPSSPLKQPSPLSTNLPLSQPTFPLLNQPSPLSTNLPPSQPLPSSPLNQPSSHVFLLTCWSQAFSKSKVSTSS